MLRYFASRVITMIPVILLITVMVFTIMHMIPGDPAYVMLGEEASPQAVRALKKELGLDQSVQIQYVKWLWKVLQGDLGRSIINNAKVLDSILDHLPATIFLTISSLLFSIIIALPVGIIAGIKPKTPLDAAATGMAMMGIALPNFLLGIILIFIFGLKLGWLPILGFVSPLENFREFLYHMILPTITLGSALAATNTRFIRSGMLEVMNKEYVTTARSKGLTETATIRDHALKNALIPIVTVMGLQLGMLFGGAVIVEKIFAIPGLGSLMIAAIFERDFPVVQGIVLFMAVVVLITNLAVDMIYTVLDPRIKMNKT